MPGPTVPFSVAVTIQDGSGSPPQFTVTVTDQRASDGWDAARLFFNNNDIGPSFNTVQDLIPWKLEQYCETQQSSFSVASPLAGLEADLAYFNDDNPNPIGSDTDWLTYRTEQAGLSYAGALGV